MIRRGSSTGKQMSVGAAVALALALAFAAPALALEPGVHVDPGSPAGKE
jgi:hypothetical protein